MAPAFVTPSVALTKSSFTRSTLTIAAPRSVAAPARRAARMLGEAPTAPEPVEAEAPETSEMVFEIPDESEDDKEYPICDPPQSVLNDRAIAEAREKFRIHETDSGSPEYQIATLTARIAYLTAHLKNNPKDHSCTRGLLKLVATRRRLLKYLKGQDKERFNNIVTGLNIRISAQLRAI